MFASKNTPRITLPFFKGKEQFFQKVIFGLASQNFCLSSLTKKIISENSNVIRVTTSKNFLYHSYKKRSLDSCFVEN